MRVVDHFKRARVMMAAIMDAVTTEARAAIGPYRSRGHGLGLPGNKHSHRKVAMDKREARHERNRARA